MSFTNEQIEALNAPLDKANVKSRAQAGRQLSYIEAWKAIEEANRIFGFDGWFRETVDIVQLGDPRELDGKYRIGYRAKVRITVGGIIREGCGFGQGIDKDRDQAHESAVKEAESDAMKRALMTFGNPFGLALYDKTQANVEDTPPKENAVGETPQQVCERLKKQIDTCKTASELDFEKSQDGFKRDYNWLSKIHTKTKLAEKVVAHAKERASKIQTATQARNDELTGTPPVGNGQQRVMSPLEAG